ncbi:hypothetical protein [Rubritalea tangerina]|uniref:hypothetical protein n=1 Tax=Rubritalea tangerina TaxID=430798 RepID=UPI00361B2DD7
MNPTTESDSKQSTDHCPLKIAISLFSSLNATYRGYQDFVTATKTNETPTATVLDAE